MLGFMPAPSNACSTQVNAPDPSVNSVQRNVIGFSGERLPSQFGQSKFCSVELMALKPFLKRLNEAKQWTLGGNKLPKHVKEEHVSDPLSSVYGAHGKRRSASSDAINFEQQFSFES